MHGLIEYSPLIAGVLNFLASAIRLAICIKTSSRPSRDETNTKLGSDP
jgi:hypothetical protein